MSQTIKAPLEQHFVSFLKKKLAIIAINYEKKGEKIIQSLRINTFNSCRISAQKAHT